MAARAQQAGVLLEPRIEVEHVETALQLVADGAGSTIAAGSVLAGCSLGSAISAVSFSEPFYDFFALVTRRGVQLSPGTQALVGLVEEWAANVAAGLQRTGAAG